MVVSTPKAPATKQVSRKPAAAQKEARKAIPQTSGNKSAATKVVAPPPAKQSSALDAAARVLAETRQPMTTRELILAMAAQGYWTSPGGRTPQATLYAAIAREIKVKADGARFVKVERGRFALVH